MATQLVSKAVASLIAGNGRYVSGHLRPKHLEEAARGHQCSHQCSHHEGAAGDPAPTIAVLACADSRVPVEMLFDMDAGELFTVQVIGNVIGEGGLASLEFACKTLGARTAVILGHSKCGAVAACCGDQAKPGVPALMRTAISPAKGSDNPVAENVRVQMRTLQDAFKSSLPHIEIVGAVFDRETAKVTFMDEDMRLSLVTDASMSAPPAAAPGASAGARGGRRSFRNVLSQITTRRAFWR